MKRKFLSLVTGVCVLFGIMCVGCSNGSSDGISDDVSVKLEERLKSAKSGETIDIIAENIILTDSASYTIEKPLTIKNGAMKNASFTVKSTGVTFDGLTDISKLTVDESVGDGDFTLQNCGIVNDVYINGGGSNSVHVSGTVIKKFSVTKENVRILLKTSSDSAKETKIEKTFIFADCKLEAETTSLDKEETPSDSTENELSFGNVVITETVGKVELAGSAVVEKLISTSSSLPENTELKIVVNVEVKIVAADSTVKDIIKNDEANSEFNEKIEEIEEADLTEEEKSEIEDDIAKIQDENENNGGTSDSDNDEDTDSGELLNFTAGEQCSDVVTITKTDSEVTVTNKNPLQDLASIWGTFIQSEYGSVKTEKGKNYKVSIDLKSDEESYVTFGTKDSSTAMAGNYEYVKVGTEYQTYSIVTGTAGHQWTAGTLGIAIGNVSKLYIKNYKIEEVSEQQNFAFQSFYINESLIEKVTTASVNDYAEITFHANDSENGYMVNVVLLNNPLEVGSLYKITMDITSDAALESGDIGIWAHSYSSDLEVAGSNMLNFEANQSKNITFYLPVYAAGTETFRIPYICFMNLSVGKQYKIRIENIAAEKTTFETIKTENSALGLYFGGDVKGNRGYYPKKSVFAVEPSESLCGEFLLCDENGWGSTENTVTSFRVFGSNDTGIVIEGRQEFYLNNNTDIPVFISFDVDETNGYKVVLKDADEDKGELLTFYACEHFGDCNQYTRSTNPDWKKNKVDSIDGLTIEKTDSEVIVTNSNPQKLDKIWKYFIDSEFGSLKVEKGKNYKISIDLKSDEEAYILLKTKDNHTTMSGNGEYVKVGTEYQTYSIFTGTAGHQWTEGIVEIAIGNVSKLYIKNYKIEEVSEQQNFGLQPFIRDEVLLDQIKASAGDNYVDIVFEKDELDESDIDKNRSGVDVVLFNHPLDVGKLYKINVDITSDTALASGEIGIWMHSYSNDVDTAGSARLSFKANETKTVTFYTPIYAGEDETFRIPYIWFTSRKKCKIRMENISATPTDLNSIKEENPNLGLYFGLWVNETWNYYPKDSVIAVGAGSEGDGQIILSDANGWWDSTENTTTSFRVVGENNTSLKAEVETRFLERDGFEDARIFISNDTDETVFITFDIDETGYKTILKDASDRAGEYIGLVNKTAYLGENWKWFEFGHRTDLQEGKWYKATYTIESAEKRDENAEAYEARINSASWCDETEIYKCYYTTNISFTQEQQVIEQVFYIDNSYGCFYSFIDGHNAIVKFSSYDVQEISKEEALKVYCGYVAGTAYLGIDDSEKEEHWTSYTINTFDDVVPGNWYKATYTIESAEKRNDSYDEWVEISSRYNITSNGINVVEFGKTRINISSEQQVIEHVFQAPGNCVESVINGHNAIVKSLSCSLALTDAPVVESCWYYYDINKSDFKTDGTFNIIFNNGSGTQTKNIEGLSKDTSVYCYDFWEEKKDENGDSYLASSPSERNDNPSEQPAEGFIRIYFYSELLESETLYLHYWESASETETKIFATSWPGVEMIKYVE